MNRYVAMSLIAVTGLSMSARAQEKSKQVKTVTTAAAESPFNLTGPGSVELSAPFGAGDRSARIKVKLLPGETTTNTEYWVLYSDDKSLLTGANIGSDFPQGRAKMDVTQSNGEIYATFYFPHAKFPTPNVKDVRPKQYGPDKKVFFQWVKRKGSTSVESPIVEFVMPDQFTIVNMGDSYAAGEGAPNPSGDKWQNARSHRSVHSGQALAVKDFRNNPGLLNVASSGAGIEDGIYESQLKLGLFEKETKAANIPPQIDQVRSWMRQNHHDTINVVLLSIGINEIGFGDLVREYFIQPGDLANNSARRARLDSDIKDLKSKYKTMRDKFDARDGFDYDKVIVSRYPNLTHGKSGNLCGKALEIHGLCWGVVEALSSEAEFRIAEAAGEAMNDTIKSVVEGFPGDTWVIGGDAAAASKNHGLCNCNDPWFNTIGASLAAQGDVDGSWHPNRTGHREMVKPIIAHDLKIAYVKIAQAFAKEAKEEAKHAAIAALKKKMEAKQKLAQQRASEKAAGQGTTPPADDDGDGN
jgi:hypothetical protein